MKVTISVEANSQKELEAVTKALGSMGSSASTTASVATGSTSESDDKAKKAAAKKAKEDAEAKAKAEAEVDLGFGDGEAEEAKEIKLEDVISAFKEYAQKHNRDAAAKILGKYSVKSVRDLKADQYAKVMKDLA